MQHATTTTEPTLRHPWVIAAIAIIALAWTWIIAAQDGLEAWERSLTGWFNDAPDGIAHVMWPVMQAGTLFCPFVVALVIGFVKRDWFVAGVVVAVGVM